MKAIDALRRVLVRARNGRPQNIADLNALDVAVGAMDAGVSADKALGLKRARAGRPRKTSEQRDATVEQVMRVLELVAERDINQDEAGLIVVGIESKLHTMNRNVAKYRRIAEWLLFEEGLPLRPHDPNAPSAREVFLGQ